MPGPRCAYRWATRTVTPSPRSCATWCWPSCGTGRSAPSRGSPPQRTVDELFGADGAPIAEFCDDQVTASAGAGRRAADVAGVGTGTRRGRRCRPRPAGPARRTGCWTRGAVPAGHGSKLARVLGTAEPEAHRASQPSDPVRRAVAENVEELLAWDRAVRADVYDSVHQMRVVTRKIRSLLQPTESFGLPDDAWVLDELQACWPASSGWRATPRCSPRSMRTALDWAGRRVGARRGARAAGRRRQAALRHRVAPLVDRRCARSGTSGCSTPWTSWWPRRRRPAARPARNRRRPASAAAYKKVRKAAKAREALRTRHRRVAAPDPQARQAPSLHGVGDRAFRGGRAKAKTVQTPARRSPGQSSSAGPICSRRPTPRTPPARTPSPTGCCTRRRIEVALKAREDEIGDALKALKKAVRK